MHASLVEILYYLRTAGPLTLVHSLYRERNQVLRSTLTHNEGEEIKLQKRREDSGCSDCFVVLFCAASVVFLPGQHASTFRNGSPGRASSPEEELTFKGAGCERDQTPKE